MTYSTTIYGTHSDDDISGTNGRDLIITGGGDDVIYAGGGRDRVYAGSGDDVVFGGGGHDRLYGGQGNDMIVGGYGSDFISGGFGDDIMTGDNTDGSRGWYDRDVFYLGCTENAEQGNDVITDFDTNNWCGGESNYDTLKFVFNNYLFTLSTGWDIVSFVNYIEHDGDYDTDAIRDGNDLIFVFLRDEDGYAVSSVRLEGVIGDDGVTNHNLDCASVDDITHTDFDAPVIAHDDDVEIESDAGAMHFDTVLDNDSFDNGLGSVELLHTVGKGTLVFNHDGSYSFDPGHDFAHLGEGETETVTFTYRVTDVDGDVDEATVTITVTGAASGPSVITGTEDGDFIVGTDNDDLINALGGMDFLFGEDGDDTLNGDGGNDVLNGGSGADILNGGEGIDFATYISSGTGVTVSLLTNTGSGGDAEGDVLNSIENLIGSRLDDVLTGDDGANTLSGREGNDVINGEGGNDTLLGGEGGDQIDGGEGVDTVSYFDSDAGVNVNLAAGTASGGDAEGDMLSNVENLLGSTLNDVLVGDAGANILNGAAGDDVLEGGAGADVLQGGRGIDTATYANSDSGVIVNLSSGQGHGGDAEGDRLSSIENVIGSHFDDVLTDGAGDNVLTGGAGADTFIFAPGNGADTITDFGHGDDVLDLSHFGFSDFDAVKDIITDTGDDLVLTFEDGSTLTLEGVDSIDDLTAEDMLL